MEHAGGKISQFKHNKGEKSGIEVICLKASLL